MKFMKQRKKIIINYDIENEFIKKMKSSLIKNYFTNSWVNLPYQNRNIEKLNEFASITDETIKEGIKKVYLIFDVIKYYREFYKELKGDVRYKFFVNSIKQPSINDKYDLELNISRGLYVYLNVMYNELKLLLEYVNSKFQSIVSTKSKEDKKEKNQPKKEKKEKKEKKKKKDKKGKLSEKEIFIKKLKREIAEEKDESKKEKKIKLLEKIEGSQ